MGTLGLTLKSLQSSTATTVRSPSKQMVTLTPRILWSTILNILQGKNSIGNSVGSVNFPSQGHTRRGNILMNTFPTSELQGLGKENSVPNAFQHPHLDQYSLEQLKIRMGPELSPKGHHCPWRMSIGTMLCLLQRNVRSRARARKSQASAGSKAAFGSLSEGLAMQVRVRLCHREACVRVLSISLWTFYMLWHCS